VAARLRQGIFNRRRLIDGPRFEYHSAMKKPDLTVVDLFCGAGGLSAGLETAGWRTVAAVDHDNDCLRTLESTKLLRLPIGCSPRVHLDGAKLIRCDIRDIRAKDLCVSSRTGWHPDLLAGGPPCQPFSSAGRMQSLRDPRGQLFTEFVRIAGELRPRFILFENVAGLVTAKCNDGNPGGVLKLVQRSFEEIGYACRFGLLNAADFGAPQRRVRLFMIGACDETLPHFPQPTHSSASVLGTHPWITLREFLGSQPTPDAKDIVRPPLSRTRELSHLKPGTGIRSKGIVEANRPSGHWGYRQDCFLADQEVPSRTIRAASTPDWIRLADSSLRRLTWIECAGLQGFPNGWAFEGTVASRFRQIGNAVQGHIARAIGIELASAAVTHKKDSPVSAEWPKSFQRRVRYTAAEHAVNGGHRAAAKIARSS
jgi:DNA (cytosine-5)-methyltransferase 1